VICFGCHTLGWVCPRSGLGLAGSPAVPQHPSLLLGLLQTLVMEKGLICWAGGTGGPHW
jgi:coenzyme F420-reducing hydrogenase gamma subunit